MGALKKIKQAIFGERKEKSKVGINEEEVAKILETMELMETRAREYSNRALKAREAAKEAIKRNNEARAKQLLKEWRYSTMMEQQYSNIAYNLRVNLDRMKQAMDMKVVSEAFEKTKEAMQRAAKLMSTEQVVKNAIELKVAGQQVDAAMKVYAKQMGLPLGQEDNEEVEKEFELLQSEVAAEAISGMPLPGETVEEETTEEKETEKERSTETAKEEDEEEEIKEILQKLKKEVSEEKQ